ncbi:MAG: acetyl-CoA carboxylase biotin carboxyl carrier protein [Thermodesulfobacteriota bacterium]|nr:MAG: acetyl-CoA carboxylase biotin carboxyl carrier protein [Thermodesulfobacteriota bacterium]
MNIKDIKALYRFIKDTDIVEVEFENADGKVRLKRGEAPGKGAFPRAEVAVSPSKEVKREAREKTTPENIKTVTAPMVGTFYRASAPDSESFVEVGSVVQKGQTLCIVEAMKLMNDVESEFSGKIVSILVENGQPVEYGEPLFYVEVAK